MKKLRIVLLVLAAVGVAAAVALHRPDVPVEELKAEFTDETSRFLELEGMEVHYKDEGEGPALVLLHGTSSSLHTWDGWADELSSDFRVVRLDFPGFGLTGPDPTDDYSIERRVELLAAFLDALGIERTHLAGNSLGGLIAWQFAARRPERVERLILLDAAGYRDDGGGFTVFDLVGIPGLGPFLTKRTPRALVAAGVEQSYADPALVTPELVDRYDRLLLRAGNREALLAMLTSRAPSDEERIRTVRQPTLVMWGRQDRLIPVAMAERFARDLPRAEVVIYDGVGHVPMEEIPERSARDARKFLLDAAPLPSP